MAKRRPGTGSITFWRGEWHATIMLADHRKVRRVRRTEVAAEAALEEIIALHRAELGYFYLTRLEGPAHPELRQRRARAGVTPRRRWEVLERDGFRCVFCGASAADGRLTIDHLQPVADGGSDEIDNLATACADCNAGKADRPPMSVAPGINPPKTA